MIPAATSVAMMLADGKQPGDQTGGNGPDFGKASPIALLVVLLLLVAVVFLVRSMTKHLRKAHRNLAEPETEEDGTGKAAGDETGEADAAETPGERGGADKAGSAGGAGG